MITDYQFQQFMVRLVADQSGPNGLILSEWEANFLASYRQSSRPLWFTQGRRSAVERMWMKYGGELKFPHPLDTVPSGPKVADADPAGCEFLMREEGRERRCNEPATCQEPRRLRYCEEHAEAVRKAMKRAGKTINLFPFNP